MDDDDTGMRYRLKISILTFPFEWVDWNIFLVKNMFRILQTGKREGQDSAVFHFYEYENGIPDKCQKEFRDNNLHICLS